MASNPSRYKTIISNEDSNIKVIKIDNIPEFDYEEYCYDDQDDYKKFIDDIEKEIRRSFEYEEYVQYLRDNFDMNKCSFFEGISNKETTKIKIHLHHSPLTLYEFVVIVLDKRKFYHESLDIEDVAKEVVYIHYCLMVGLIPLCETAHQLVHNEFLFVPTDRVLGNYKSFMEMYDPWIPVQIKQKIARLEEYTRTYNEAENMGILQPSFVYIDLSGTYKLPKYEDIYELMSKRMNIIKQNNYSMEPIPLVVFIDENGNVIKDKH